MNLFWRTVITDSESPDGIAPICPTHPLDRDTVTDCCPEPQIETHSVELAKHLVTLLNSHSANYHALLPDCPDSFDKLHCSHYQEGDRDCCHCGKPNWLPEGDL